MTPDIWLQLRVSDIRAGWRAMDRAERWTPPRREPRQRITRSDVLTLCVFALLLIVVVHSPLVGG